MSQAPLPDLPPTSQRRQRSRRDLQRPEPGEPEPSDLAAGFNRRQSKLAAKRRRPPLLSFGLGLGLGFLLAHQQGLPLGSGLANLKFGQQQLGQMLLPLGLGQRRVLVLGSDQVSGNTDVMMAVQVQNGLTSIIQVPRDTYVETAAHGVLKANAIYGMMGPEAVKSEVSALLGMPVERYLKLNLAAVSKAADALGGVSVDVPKRMFYQDRSQGLYIDLYPGQQLLKGEALEGFLRFRHDESGDLGRMERQRLVINQVFGKLAQPATLAQLPALLKIADEDIHTDLSPLEITQLLAAMAHTKLSSQRLPGREFWENDLSYWMPASNSHHPSDSGTTTAP
jgi:LCP family protein required for cell wall assembly